MLTAPDALPTATRVLLGEVLRLQSALNSADEIQWEPSHTPKPREDTSQRASGGHGDPTGDIVLDPQRMALRDAVTAAEKARRDAILSIRKAHEDVTAAVARWNGE
ncbi:hypothetical protein SEA_NITRO_42 [Arthrobacter phage Nitro]|uniref:Uncharacterized protein n=1 Tax=Arthrobacter phage Nitro TaxID=3077792 RepID=A0AA96HK05_9CAUD|nr:hypothetical protein SEA_NITRO_42 [Arthrobacter phage Nitro]